MNKKAQKHTDNNIAFNRKASHDYFFEQRFEAGIVLEGWEVKSIRAGKAQITDSYVKMINGEAWILGMHISPLKTVSTHVNPDPIRTRKLLLNQAELSKLYGSTERKGYTLVPVSMYWKKNKIKLEIALAKGKKTHDKRASIKERDWKREKARLLKRH